MTESLRFSGRAALLRLATTAAVLMPVALTRSPGRRHLDAGPPPAGPVLDESGHGQAEKAEQGSA